MKLLTVLLCMTKISPTLCMKFQTMIFSIQVAPTVRHEWALFTSASDDVIQSVIALSFNNSFLNLC